MINKKNDLNIKTGLVFSKIKWILFITAILMLFLSFVLYNKDTHYFYYSYLTSYSFYLSITLGGMFFVLIHYLTSAGWSVAVKRIPELFMNNMWLMAVLTIPVLFGIHDLYHWSHLDAVLHDHLLQIKQPYLNTPFFIIRLILYFSIWFWISKTFFKGSLEQDETKDPNISIQLQRKSTYSMILFALTLTFAFIDLVMSLTSHWYSTIFGVYMFAGAVLVSLCFISLGYLFLRSKGFLKDLVTIEHYHDLGKLIYGFNIFWTYIAFCQFFLIWYANVPEETIFYAKHFVGSWSNVALLLVIGHFVIPFALFMSRWVKRNLLMHALMAIWLVFMHFVDLYWIIMPNVVKEGFNFNILDISLFLGLGALYFGFVLQNIEKVNLIPKGDPRLKESLSLVNF